MKHYNSTSPKHRQYIEKLERRNKQKSPKMFLKEEYTRSHDKLLFCCENGHENKITAYSVTNGTGCAVCSGKKSRTTKEFIDYLDQNTDWTLVEGEEYRNVKTPIRVRCKNGHIRSLSPDLIISQDIGCAVCSKKARKTKKGFLKELNTKRSKRGLLPLAIREDQQYVNSKTKMIFLCSVGHEWESCPSDMLYQMPDCPTCNQKNFSRKAILWLESIANKEKIYIQHAGNAGEFTIPGSNYRADGYCKFTNTVYEFHGDKFHGNLVKYAPDDRCHPFDSNVTALELYDRTIRKEEFIKHKGYNLVVIWESDYDNIS